MSLLNAFVDEDQAVPAARSPRWAQALRPAVVWGFGQAGRQFVVDVHGIGRFHNRPATVVIANHTTDWDLPLLVPPLWKAGRQTVSVAPDGHNSGTGFGDRCGPIGRCAFAAGEHMFETGYLGGYVLHKPQWLRRLIYPLSLSGILQAMRVYPMAPSKQRKLGLHLRAIRREHGNLPLSEVFADTIPPWLTDAGPTTPLRSVLRWKHHNALERYCRFSIFQPEIARPMRQHHLRGIQWALRRLASVLAAGDSVFISPEAGLSSPTWSGQIKAGLSRLVTMAGRDITVLPVRLKYEPEGSDVTRGRGGGQRRVEVTVCEELRGVQDWPRERLEAEVRQALLGPVAPKKDNPTLPPSPQTIMPVSESLAEPIAAEVQSISGSNHS